MGTVVFISSFESFRLQHSFKQADTGCCKDYIISEKQYDVEVGGILSRENAGCGCDHAQHCWNGNGKQEQGQHELAAARAQGHGGEERAVDHQRPGSEQRDGNQLPRGTENAQVVEDYEQRRHQRFQQTDEEKVAKHLRHKKCSRGGGRDSIGIEHLIAQFARPGLVQRNHRGEQKSHPNQAADNVPRFFGQGVERKDEDHHHQQREEQHGVERILGAPLQADVFGQRGKRDRPERSHDSPTRERLGVRSMICPACIHTNSSATPSSSTAWCVTTKTVLPASRMPLSKMTISRAEWTSTLENGSSSNNIFGSCRMARASDKRLRLPFGYFPTGRRNSGSSPTERIACSQRESPPMLESRAK